MSINNDNACEILTKLRELKTVQLWREEWVSLAKIEKIIKEQTETGECE